MESTTTLDNLRQLFETIRDERNTAANTSTRIGNAYLALLSYIEGCQTQSDNKGVLDEITSAKINNWDGVYNWYASVTTPDTDTVINKWQEIIKFLDGISSSTDLNAIISGINGSISDEVTRAKTVESANASNITALQGYFTSGSAKTAVKLLTARSLWGNAFDGTGNINGNIVMKSDDGTYIQIGGARIVYDKTNSALYVVGGDGKTSANFYSTGGVSAFGANTNISSGGSGTTYDRLDKWSDYTVGKATDVLSALLGNDLNERLKKVEAGALTAVDWSIITSIPTINGTSLKGSSVVTAKWGTERMLTIGQTAKSVDGSENVAWSLVEIGAAAAAHTHVWKDITDHPTAVSAFTNDSGYTTNKGTVTSVGLSVPTGLSVSGSPVTVSGTLAIAFASGYSIPTTAKQGNWDVAYTNNHTHANKTILDGITAALISDWNSVYNWYTGITASDTDTVINKWQEIIKFLDGISSSTDLNAIISGINGSISDEVTRAKTAESANAANITTLQGYFASGSAKTAVKLLTAQSLWGNAFNGTGNINGNIVMKSDDGTYIQIGGARIVYDSTNSALYVVGADGKTSANFYSTGGVSAFGANTNISSGGSGTSYDRLDKWSDYTVEKATDVLSALLGNDLNERLKKVEAGALTAVDWSIIINKPSTFTPSVHTHVWSDITDHPTKLSAFTNDAGFITTSAIPTKLSQLTNDSGFITSSASISGNAATATKFAAAQVISLTGDITGSASSQAGWNIGTTIGTGKVTNAMLAGAIDNSKLSHSTITIAGITIALGGSVAADSITSAASKLGLVTKGSAVQPVYLNAGIPTVCSYAFGNGNGNVPVSNGTVNSNLNADMLDGYHYADINRYAIAYWKSGWYKVAEVTNAANNERFIVFDVVNSNSSSHAILYIRGRANGTPSMTCAYNLNFDISQFRLYYDGYRYSLYAYIPSDWQGKVFRVINEGQEGNGQKSWDLFSYSSNVDPKALDSESSTTYIIPQYAGVGYSATKLCRNSDPSLPTTFNWSGQSGQPTWLWGGNDGTNMYVYNPSNFNVASASKLTTARTIWGQSFDGTGNVDGLIEIHGSSNQSVLGGDYPCAIRLTNYYPYIFGSGGEIQFGVSDKDNEKNLAIIKGIYSDYSNSVLGGSIVMGTKSVQDGLVHEHFRINSLGNIGIGTTSPAYKLDVNGTLHAAGPATLSSTLDVAGLTHIGGTLELYNLLTFNLAEGHFGTSYGYTDPWSGLNASFKFGGSVAMTAAYINGLVHAAGPVILDSALNVKGVSAFANYISMGSNRINFGTLNSTGWGYAFYADDSGMNIDCTSESLKALGIFADTVTVNGNFLSTGGVTAYTSSDRRLKMNIQPVNSLAVIRTLGGTFQFDWRKDGKHSIGFIAQNVEQSQLSSMVYNKDGYLKLNYLDTRLISLALGASMQLDDEVTRLKKKVAGLEKEVETLKQAS